MALSERVQLVWLKRDLRIHDHRPLFEAARSGPVICAHVYEPEVLRAEDFDACHLEFINDSLRELRANLRRLGGELTLRVGSLPDLFAEWNRTHRIEAVWCHEETGNRITFDRDRRVIRWCREQGVAYREFPQNGVVRRLKTRDGWAREWQARMSSPCHRPPDSLRTPEGLDPGEVRSANSLGLTPSTKSGAQVGGESAGREALHSFLERRGVNYRADMSSPLAGETGCSRVSPYLAWGCLTIKQVHQAADSRAAQLRRLRAAGEKTEAGWLKSLSSFQGRLRWHCHFMQKLEDEPEIEFENMNRGFDGLREDDFNEALFDAWRLGETGYPMVDACMRALHRSGWINFRMRAMLVSFAAHHLWLHWRRPALYLARQFVDYEPGIHYSQFQMQSGVTGINTVRIYSPIKQARDQDPSGAFIREHAPELEAIPDEYLAEPHRMPPILQQDVGCVIGRDYPRPIVEHKVAYQMARQRIHARRQRAEVREASERVYKKHGSRRRTRRRG